MAQNKKTSKNKNTGILSNINLKSRKTQSIILFLTIAVIGGYFTYKSFADTTVQSVQAAVLPGAVRAEETKESTGKQNKMIARIAPGKSLKWNVYANVMNPSTAYRVCATVRYENPSSSSKPSKITFSAIQRKGLSFNTQTGTFATTDRYAFLHSSYTTECSNQFNGWGADAATFELYNGGPSTVRAGIFLLNNVGPAANRPNQGK